MLYSGIHYPRVNRFGEQTETLRYTLPKRAQVWSQLKPSGIHYPRELRFGEQIETLRYTLPKRALVWWTNWNPQIYTTHESSDLVNKLKPSGIHYPRELGFDQDWNPQVYTTQENSSLVKKLKSSGIHYQGETDMIKTIHYPGLNTNGYVATLEYLASIPCPL